MLPTMFLSSTGYTMMPASRSVVHSVVNRPASAVMMADDIVDAVTAPTWNDPREGKPFGEADGPNRPIGKIREAVEVYQPRGLSDATVIKPAYIETDDEPWHATCKSTVALTADLASTSYSASLPFIDAENDLLTALSKVEKAADAKSAMDAALKAGARPGCPAIMSGEKLIASFAKDAEKALKDRPKAPKTAAQGKGWDGMARQIGKVHDNSVA